MSGRSTAGAGGLQPPISLRWWGLVAAGLLLLTLACFGQTVRFDFINLDDGVYVAENPHVKAGLTLKSVRWAFFTTAAANWHPVTWLSLMADTSMFGPAPGGYHLTNLILHAANTLLLFHLLVRLTGRMWAAAFAAALFAVHPLHVESVAWISERKDVLSTFFGLLSLLFYRRYAVAQRRGDYWGCFAALLAGLLAKPMLVTWPFVFLLLDWWPLARIDVRKAPPWIPGRRAAALIREKIPFFLPAALICWTTVAAQRAHGAMDLFADLPFGARLANAAVSYGRYLVKTVAPLNLSVFYPHAGSRIEWAAVAAAALFLAAVTAAVVAAARRHPYAPFGWFWFLGTLVPVIGLVQVGSQAMADRYTYIPLIGIFVLLAWGAADIAAKWRLRPVFLAVPALLILAVLALTTHRQTGYWENSLTLFGRVLAVAPQNDLAHNNYGIALERAGRLAAAAQHYRTAVSLNPRNAQARNNLANRLFAERRLDAAAVQYRKAIALQPNEPAFHYNLGVALAHKGDGKGAIEAFAATLALDPGFARVHHQTGMLLVRHGRHRAADRFFEMARGMETGTFRQHDNRRNSRGRTPSADDADHDDR